MFPTSPGHILTKNEGLCTELLVRTCIFGAPMFRSFGKIQLEVILREYWFSSLRVFCFISFSGTWDSTIVSQKKKNHSILYHVSPKRSRYHNFSRNAKNMNRYSLISEIGNGTYGSVYKAFNKENGDIVS